MKNLLYIVFLFVFVSACSTKPENKPYSWDDDLHRRLLTDFCLTESQVKDYIRKYIPDVTDEQMRQWEASNALECMVLDGEKRYFRNAGPNLFRVDSACYDIKIANLFIQYLNRNHSHRFYHFNIDIFDICYKFFLRNVIS